MILDISLQNFRNYKKASFKFSPKTTLIVGKNTAGKTNLIEAVYLLSAGKSFRAEKDPQMLKIGEEIGRVRGQTEENLLEVVLTGGSVAGQKAMPKKFLVSGVSKRRIDFEGILNAVLFSPQDLEIVIGTPSLRRDFLDSVLEQIDRDYRIALLEYFKALRQRNALLSLFKDTGRRNDEQFEYWDSLLISNGSIITQKREELIEKINKADKEIFDFQIFYDKSTISPARLLEYKDAEVGAGVTLVGPHRDDFYLKIGLAPSARPEGKTSEDLRFFGSRGQQRLAVLQLKILELKIIEETLAKKPILLLDDIFSELDSLHIDLVWSLTSESQTIITTTHEEFLPAGRHGKPKRLKDLEVIELGK